MARLRFAIVCSAVLSAVGASAHAQVLEIGPAGAVTRHDGPAVFNSDGSTPIEVSRRTPSASSGVAAFKSRGAWDASSGERALTRAADASELSPALVAAVAWAESRFRPGLISRAGAIGEMQLMPGTARALRVDPRDTAQNYRGGAAYLRALLAHYGGDIVLTLAAYNAGPGAVDRYAGVPPYPETRAYVAAVLERLSGDGGGVGGGQAVGQGGGRGGAGD